MRSIIEALEHLCIMRYTGRMSVDDFERTYVELSNLASNEGRV